MIVDELVVEAALRMFEGTGDSRALTLAILVRHEEWEQVVTMTCNPRNYLDASSYAKAAMSTGFFKKYEHLPTKIDRRKKAIETFWKGEVSCYKANERLSLYTHPDRFIREGYDGRMEFVFSLIRKKIFRWLGARPNSSRLELKFGPGGTFSDPAQYSTLPNKMSSLPTMTRPMQSVLPLFWESAWGRYHASNGRSPVIVKGNRFSIVSKDAKTGRGISSEPSVNITYQLGLGRLMRNALRHHGIDLDTCATLHKQVAREASVTRLVATLDATNASGSLCYNLVKLCMPSGWFEVLDQLRSPMTRISKETKRSKEKWVKLEQFSSMGNGYTFEMETILFAAICSVGTDLTMDTNPCLKARIPSKECVLGRDVFVFGDDMIVPIEAVPLVTAILRFCGISLNEEKSFFEDEPFRESCGGDFFDGVDVRPYQLKGVINGPEDLIVLANGIRQNLEKLRFTGANLNRAWFHVLDAIPSHIRRCRGPKDLGDIVIHDREDTWQTRKRGEVRYVRCYRPVKHHSVPYGAFDDSVVLACATYGLRWNRGGVAPRDSVRGYGVKWVPFNGYGVQNLTPSLAVDRHGQVVTTWS